VRCRGILSHGDRSTHPFCIPHGVKLIFQPLKFAIAFSALMLCGNQYQNSLMRCLPISAVAVASEPARSALSRLPETHFVYTSFDDPLSAVNSTAAEPLQDDLRNDKPSVYSAVNKPRTPIQTRTVGAQLRLDCHCQRDCVNVGR
jgi:hypothetical protein